MTDAEWKMWHILRDLDWPQAHFRRQMKIGPYFPDFISLRYKLVIEVDGSQHSDARGAAHDQARTEYLRRCGFDVMRFDNIDVLKNSSGVFDVLHERLSTLTPTPRLRRFPSPQGGGA